MSNRLTYIIAGALLAIMFISALTSSLGDSTTMDESAHIPAGYSYLSQKDYRINPEHPPLVKDLAALPLLGLNLNFPSKNGLYWQGVNEQWWFGNQFLYQSGNDADQILFWARLPMMLILIILGLFIFFWTKELGGNAAALLVLTIFSFCPTFLAHGRLVTTDVAASLGVVMSSYFWLKSLKEPSRKNIVLAGLIWGISMLFKFSLILLVPFFAVITVIAILLKYKGLKRIFLGFMKYVFLALAIAVIMILVIWPVYQFHVLNYPIEKQVSDTKTLLGSSPSSLAAFKNICIWMSEKPLLRPLAHYMLGLLMATQRTAAGNTVYFMGMVSASGWWYYFPTVYFLKVPLAFHILSLIALFWAIYLIKEPLWKRPFSRIGGWIENHFAEFSMMVFILIYWTTSLIGHLNIGVRHVLPTFPFIYILVSLGIIGFMNYPLLKGRGILSEASSFVPTCRDKTKTIKKQRKIAVALIGVLLAWYIGSSLSTWPSYLSYFNEIAGGSDNGYKYVVDSNYDWGQDLKRLKKWTEENNIDKIYIDYFGGSDTRYYFGEKYLGWQGTNKPSDLPKGSYLAISATFLQGGRGNPAPGFTDSIGYYLWLNNYKPVTRIGKSIFVYYIE